MVSFKRDLMKSVLLGFLAGILVAVQPACDNARMRRSNRGSGPSTGIDRRDRPRPPARDTRDTRPRGIPRDSGEIEITEGPNRPAGSGIEHREGEPVQRQIVIEDADGGGTVNIIWDRNVLRECDPLRQLDCTPRTPVPPPRINPCGDPDPCATPAPNAPARPAPVEPDPCQTAEAPCHQPILPNRPVVETPEPAPAPAPAPAPRENPYAVDFFQPAVAHTLDILFVVNTKSEVKQTIASVAQASATLFRALPRELNYQVAVIGGNRETFAGQAYSVGRETQTADDTSVWKSAQLAANGNDAASVIAQAVARKFAHIPADTDANAGRWQFFSLMRALSSSSNNRRVLADLNMFGDHKALLVIFVNPEDDVCNPRQSCGNVTPANVMVSMRDAADVDPLGVAAFVNPSAASAYTDLLQNHAGYNAIGHYDINGNANSAMAAIAQRMVAKIRDVRALKRVTIAASTLPQGMIINPASLQAFVGPNRDQLTRTEIERFDPDTNTVHLRWAGGPGDYVKVTYDLMPAGSTRP